MVLPKHSQPAWSFPSLASRNRSTLPIGDTLKRGCASSVSHKAQIKEVSGRAAVPAPCATFVNFRKEPSPEGAAEGWEK
jgi:hypothetical protein